MHHRFPIKDFGNDGVNEIQSVNRAMKDAYFRKGITLTNTNLPHCIDIQLMLENLALSPNVQSLLMKGQTKHNGYIMVRC